MNCLEILDQENGTDHIKENMILGQPPKMCNSKIIFKGKGNIFFCEANVQLSNSNIVFNGDNSLIYLSSNRSIYYLNTTINHDSVFYMGKDNYMNGKLSVILSEQKNILIGSEGLFSFSIWLRTADPHLIYDAHTKRRINDSRSIYIGDHAWIGQGALILKGTQIGSGSIIGAQSVVSGKTIESNTSYAGNPAKKIRGDIFFTGKSVHGYRQKETEKVAVFEGEDYIYQQSADTLSFMDIESKLTSLSFAKDKLKYLMATLDRGKNRFYIGKQAYRKSGDILRESIFFKKRLR